MTSQAAEVPGQAAASRRSKLTPEREQEFFDAVLEQIRACGYEAVSMEAVASSTRCSKSTLYRQWRTKPQFVAAALRAANCPRFGTIDTGSLAGDLREVARVAGETSTADTRLHQALGHASMQDEELRAALRDALVDPELAALRQIFERAAARGEIAADHPALPYVAPQILGVVRVRPLLEGRFADEEYLLGFIEAAVMPALGLDCGRAEDADGGG